MKLLFDLSGTQTRGQTTFHGGGEYIKSFLEAVLDARDTEELLFLARRDRDDSPWVMALLGNRYPIFRHGSNPEISAILADQRPDVFFSGLPYSYAGVVYPEATKVIYTIHGLREIECPWDRYQIFFETGWKARLKHRLLRLRPGALVQKELEKVGNLLGGLRPQDRVLAVSEHTKYSLLNHLGPLGVPVQVAYSPEKPGVERGAAVLGPPYLLMVSGNRWVKNTIRGLLAFDDLVERRGSLLGNLCVRVVGGAPRWIRKRLRHPERVHFLPYQSEASLEALYADAHALFYPTLNEGFGYPPLEAMKYGTPVLVSATTSLTEVLGAGALYFDPRSLIEMQTRILAVLQPDVRQRASTQASARYEGVRQRQQRDLKAVVDQLLLRSPL